MPSLYLENFKNNEDIIESYGAPTDALRGARVLLAWYGYGSYCGSSIVVFRKGGKLYEVNGSHCSCMGLEGQWEPEETTPEALLQRDFNGEYDGGANATEKLHAIARRIQSLQRR